MIDGLEILGIVTLVVSAAYVVVLARRRVRLPVPSPILPARELQRQYGLYAENRPTIRLDPDKVPAHLRDLIPVAETWGIGDDIVRLDFEQKAPASARDELVARVGDRADDVQAWLRSLPEGAELSEEAAAFLYMLKAWDEVRPLGLPTGVERA